jgi:hypothetical protein
MEKGWRVTFAFEETCDFVELESGEDFFSGVCLLEGWRFGILQRRGRGTVDV